MEKQDLLKAVGECRGACTKASGQAPIGGEVYKACSGVTNAIDVLAETLTGRRSFLVTAAQYAERSKPADLTAGCLPPWPG
ncbi:hypothetical protein VQ02_04235 [Methylobacterium variabile]|uniref:Uncharacterized protein n=1 Tax=Methylobacterium variabile TaxID=298794 RepID=A0A0J6VS68_9HYPH|nr:hypothetical protein [Methylobacterium variabile]KMO42066.1 hypothetical protein VQ02_04235 [Methylobacterium variabile]